MIERGLSEDFDLNTLSKTPVTIYFCYPEDWKGWLAGCTAFLLGRSNSFVTHVCFKVGKNLQVDFNSQGVQTYFSEYPVRPVSYSLIGVLRDKRVLSRVSAYEEAEHKFHWTSVLPTLWNNKCFFTHNPTCCSFTSHCLTGVDLHFDPDNLSKVLEALL